MRMRNLIKKLKEQPHISDPHASERKEDWLQAIDGLYKNIEHWIEPATQEGLFTTSRSSKELREPDFGDYTVPILHIQYRGSTIRLEPVTGRVVGMVRPGRRSHTPLRGRVDLICGPYKIPVVREANGVWKTIPLQGEPQELTEKVFEEILSEILLDE
jgi:hypothetical protein